MGISVEDLIKEDIKKVLDRLDSGEKLSSMSDLDQLLVKIVLSRPLGIPDECVGD